MIMSFQLNSQNYHSNEANQQYMSVSQFKNALECEARLIAEMKGEFTRPQTTALMVGSYTHAAFESEQAFVEFCEENHNSIFKSRGGKYADFEQADKMIETLKNDRFAMFALDGEKEVIFTGEIFGVPWKIKVDSINHERRSFSDLKTTQSLYKRYWSEKYNKYVSFVEAYDYVLQMAIYREIIYQNTGQYYVPYLVTVTKETPPDKEILEFEISDFDFEFENVKTILPSIIEAKNSKKEPVRCGKCEYCRMTKQLTRTIKVGYLLE
ncbi:PD-(D/E)XK nuclease-like domain-containing protein [Lysinibacillus sp. FSL M8-0216]|uniref:PD-(D/E)XK nuclease-like domain-containing protein n=1 Tax=Lysinibacillus sp. FSL M8-0216 TaxID=2921619 RepID=UPI00315999C4